jgi:hypothetical protein
MKTTENNKIIAEFMNYANGKPLTDGLLNTLYNDWNSVMSVVDKIEGLDYWTSLTGELFEVGKNGSLTAIIFYVGSLRKETKFEAVRNGCLEFIKWYNENAAKEN